LKGEIAMPDKALQELDRLIGDLNLYIANHYNEADTRVKFIDPLLTHVLGWNEHLHIRREEQYKEQEEKRCIDYVLSLQDPVLVVEAKKVLKEFEIPTKINRACYSLSGVIRNWTNAWDAILQAQEYCIHEGARYALVTNGRQFIAFKAISESPAWTKGYALVLGSPDALRANFTLFYECLSKEAIAQDRLTDLAFPREVSHLRQRPRAQVKVSNSGYRNQLYSVIDSTFRDVLLDVPKNDPNFLRNCYCSSEDAMRYTGHLNSVVVDPLPAFRSPVEQIRPGHRKDAFHGAIATTNCKSSGVPLFVVMGGVGAGKTSFLHWYFESQIPKEAKSHSVVVFCDYRTVECPVDDLHSRTLRMVIDDIIAQTEGQTTAFNQLREIFRVRVERELRGALKPYAEDASERDKQVAQLLQKYQDYSLEHLEALVNFIHARIGSRVILVLDNMDQKSPELQDKLYQIGHEFVYRCNLIVVVSLRESTFRRISRSAAVNAFASREFHVKAQPLSLVLSKRLAFLQKQLSPQKIQVPTEKGTLDVLDIHRFISLMERSLLSDEGDPRILNCIVAVSNNDIREQLRMVYSFLISGQTKVDDYFWKYAANSRDAVPFHEVLHSVIYEDHKYFDEGTGHRFMNIFEPAPGTHTSHFTGLRILAYLEKGLGQTGDLRGTDFVTVDDLFEKFGDYGWTREEIGFQFQRLAHFGLLMPESGSVGDGLLTEACALTQCGIYYLNSLYAEFSYFSAMASDTSIGDQRDVDDISATLRESISEPKISLNLRVRMARRFVGYLDSREQMELKGALRKHPLIGAILFVPRMKYEVSAFSRG
jgi:predicted type IV restriction endonuclease